MFIAHVLTRNIRAEEDLVDRLFNSTEKRLARSLLLLVGFRAQMSGDQHPQPRAVDIFNFFHVEDNFQLPLGD